MGVARSGTSLATQTLYHLGIHMGDKVTSGSIEDLAFAEQVKSNSAELNSIVERRNTDHKTWGFKLTSSFASVSSIASKLEKPLILTPMRDLVAVLNRRKMAKDRSIEDLFGQYVKQQVELFDFLTESDLPQLIYSHRDAVENPRKFVAALISVLGVDVSKETVDSCVANISGDENRYTEAFYQNHESKFETEDDVRNAGIIEINEDIATNEMAHSAWGLKEYEKKNSGGEGFIRPTVRSIRRHLDGEKKALRLVVDDCYQLSKSDNQGPAIIWGIREAFASQERLIRVIFKKQTRATLVSLEKMTSEDSNRPNKQDIIKAMKRPTRNAGESPFRANVTNEYGHIAGWVLNIENRAHEDFEIFAKGETVAKLKNNIGIKTREGKLMGVSEFGISIKLNKPYLKTDLTLVHKKSGHSVLIKTSKQIVA